MTLFNPTLGMFYTTLIRHTLVSRIKVNEPGFEFEKSRILMVLACAFTREYHFFTYNSSWTFEDKMRNIYYKERKT